MENSIKFDELNAEFLAKRAEFNNCALNLKNRYEKTSMEIRGKITLPDSGDMFSLFYILSESARYCDELIKNKPSRELSIIKTKIQEARMWFDEINNK